MSAIRQAVRERDARAVSLGHVPRPLDLPRPSGSLAKIHGLLEQRTHGALLRRIRG